MSKGLETLEKYKRGFITKEYQTIEKELKALDIIKKKEVNVKLFILSATTMIVDVEKQTISKQAQLEMYNYGVIDNTSFVRDYSKCLTEEEYDLLKEELL